VSDGTAAGTTFLGDLNPGAENSQPNHFVATGLGRVVFYAIEAGSGGEVWSTDGTAAGTYVLDVRPGAGSGFYGEVGRAPGGGVILSANDGKTGDEPYWTDGVDLTPEHWRSLGDVHPSGDSDPYSFVLLGGHTYFSANVPSGNGELFRTDGTAEGTEKLTGDEARSMTPFAHMKGDLYGTGYGDGGIQLFRYSPGGAVQMLGELPTYSDPAYAYAADLVPVGGHLYFTLDSDAAGPEVWRTDGKDIGEVLVDLVPGPDGSAPTQIPWVVGRSVVWQATRPDVAAELFAYTTRSSTTKALPARSYSLTEAREKRIRVPVRVGPRTAKLDGTVVLTQGGRQIGRGVLVDGVARVRIKEKLGVGVHRIRATYTGSWDARRSTSEPVDVVVAR
jgi:ELWxxDGT repeat protein